MENNKTIKKNKVLKVILVIVLSIFICLAVLITFFTVFYLNGTNSKSSFINVKAVKPNGDAPVNILLAGVDVGSKDINDTTKGDDIKKANSIILFHYEPENKDLKIISIPRDSLINVDKEPQKINYASSVDGPKYVVSSVESLMNTKINYYVQLDYPAFRNIIDSLGGVTMNINKNMNYDDNAQDLHINFQNDTTVKLDGQQSEEYYRWVKNNDGTGLVSGDIGRIKDQQSFIDASMQKFGGFSTIFKYPSIISALSKNIESNMSTYDVLKYARIFSHLDKSKVTMCTAEGLNVGIGGNEYYLIDTAGNNKILDANAKVSDDVNKQALKIEILNGTTKNGLAKGFKTDLNNKGFTNITTGNSPQKPIDKTKVTFYGIDEDKISEIKNDMGNDIDANSYELVQEKSEKYDIVILLGNDINK
jgi:LCP family protein required for cell wall assembly